MRSELEFDDDLEELDDELELDELSVRRPLSIAVAVLDDSPCL